ncbi:transketolase [Ensifer sp. ENS06]|uniref:transketolase n=1 Tax=Ensifer sp. ENS06 TaxID=2769276 RepID=UPI0028120879|nr:transketolase [Ensifer sp. ENS06]
MASTCSLIDPRTSEMANALRFLAVDAVEKAQSGHPGMPLGMADLATVLFTRHLKYDASEPDWADRDRFVLSNGHGSMLLYGVLHLAGYEEATLDELKHFRQAHSRAAGHPEYGYLPGIETTTGPLGQGIATAVGMAIAERLLVSEFGPELVDHRTWVFCGDGCLMEGISQEAISLAGHLNLAKLTVVFDDNGTTIDGATSIATSDDQRKRFEASNWATIAVDGHDPEAIDRAFAFAKASDRPTLIAARTHIGFGAPTKQGKSVVHGSPLGAEELAAMREKLSWPHAPFEVPAPLLAGWRDAGRRGRSDRDEWQARLAKAPADLRVEFTRRIAGILPEGLEETVKRGADEFSVSAEPMPIRQASQKAVGLLAELLPEIVGGSADLTSSVLSRPAELAHFDINTFSGRHLPYGIREHGMAAAMNGIALHGGFIPFGGTYLTFSDYCRPSIRLAALMGINVVFLFSHDSIGVGEDGPTHQPIEHLASLRAMPGIRIYRPADAVEALECWYDAIADTGPSVMVVARQKVAPVRKERHDSLISRRGGYILSEPAGRRDLTLLATGSEVQLAVATQVALAEHNVQAAVVSMPCLEVFDRQSEDYRMQVLGSAPRYVVEAASSYGWHRYLGDGGRIFGIDVFGFSAPGPEVYAKFGLTPTAIAAVILSDLGRDTAAA